MSSFRGTGQESALRVWDGVVAHAVAGDRSTLAVVELAPGAAVPEHSHANEQLGVCVSGSIRFTVDGETREVRPGDMWRILGDVPHDVVAGPDGAVVVESFAPARTDWAGLERLDDHPAPRWPS